MANPPAAPAPQPTPAWYWRWGSNVYRWGGYAYNWGHSAVTLIPSTIKEVRDTSAAVRQFVNNPTPFAAGATSGVLQGYAAGAQAGGAGPAVTTSLSERVSQIVLGGVSSASGAVMHKLLEHSETYDLDPADQELKSQTLRALTQASQSQQSTLETAKKVWDKLNNYHIIISGVNLNVKTSSDPAMREEREKSEGKNNDGVSPIHSLVRCQENWRTLRAKHGLTSAKPSLVIPQSPTSRNLRPAPSEEEVEAIKKLEGKTSEMVKKFGEKSVHYATMYTIHQIANLDLDPAIYKQILQEGGDIKTAYLGHFTGIRKFFYKIAFKIISWLIGPIIAPTIEQVVNHLRSFLKNDVDLLHFVEQKVKDMAEYYGRIEKGRKDYLNRDRRTDECGTFETFLEETIQVYGKKKMSKEELMKVFGEYIVENFVPSPQVAVGGHRIPLISSLLEWIGHAIRKSIVRHVLKRTNIVQNLLKQGTNSVHYAQLGLKRLLEQKLAQVCEMITRSRALTVEPLLGGVHFPNPQLDLEAKKTQIISRQLHLAIQQHSAKLLRFIDTEACNGDDRRLADLDNKVSAFVQEVITAVSDLFKKEPFSIRQVLEDASTHAMETALLSLFEDKDRQIETQLQTIFEVLDKSYEYIPNEERAEKERRFLEECAEVDTNLRNLQEQLSRTAVEAALEKHLKNASGERHKSIKTYVIQEKILYRQFIRELDRFEAQLSTSAEGDSPSADQIKEALSQVVTLIEQYLSHISIQLRSPELEGCYSDVKGDLHNIYSAVIVDLNKLHEQLALVADSTDLIKVTEEEIAFTEQVRPLMHDFPIHEKADEAKKRCEELDQKLPPTIRAALESTVTRVSEGCDGFAEQAQSLAMFDQKAALERQERDTLQRQELLKQFEKQLKELQTHARAYHDLTGTNRTYPTQEAVSGRRQELIRLIEALLGQLRAIADDDIKALLTTHLKAANTEQLYEVFYPSVFSTRQAPIYAALATLNLQYDEKLVLLRTQKSSLPATPEHRDPLIQALESSEATIKADLQIITREIENNFRDQLAIRRKAAAQIRQAQQKGFDVTHSHLVEIASHFHVKGCIAVGEIQLSNTLAPELTARIAPEIVKGTRTMIDAMGKPFHYEQMVLRLLFLDISDRHTTSQSG